MSTPFVDADLFSDFMDGRAGAYPDPYVHPGIGHIPRSIHERMQFLERLYMANSLYRVAGMRASSYLIGPVQVEEGNNEAKLSRDEVVRMQEFLTRTIESPNGRGMKAALRYFHQEVRCYYNCFSSTYRKFFRYLSCPRCRHSAKADRFLPVEISGRSPYEGRFLLSEGYWGVCPACRYRGVWEVFDHPSNNPRDIRIKFWSPKEIHIIYDSVNRRAEGWVWRIPEMDRNKVRRGYPAAINNLPLYVLKAIAENKNILYPRSAIFHAAILPPTGFDTEGWGIGWTGTESEAYHYQVLKRQNLAIAHGFVTPMRFITPAPRLGSSGGGAGGIGGIPSATLDPMAMTDGASVVDWLRRLAMRHRVDPDSLHFCPFPIEYRVVGGDASQLAPVQLLDNQSQSLLNMMDIPVEMYNMTMSVTQQGQMVTLFEQANGDLLSLQDDFVDFHAQNAAVLLGWSPSQCGIEPPSLRGDLARIQLMAQLNQAGKVPDQAVLKPLGMDQEDTYQQIVTEEVRKQEIGADAQKQLEDRDLLGQALRMQAFPGADQMMQQGQGGGGAPPQGDPSQAAAGGAGAQMQMALPGSGSGPTTVTEMDRVAQQLASQYWPIAMQGSAESKSVLAQIEMRQGKTMKMMVQGIFDQNRAQMRSQAYSDAKEQQGG